MKKTMTYPLNVALELSPEWGAILETESVQVRVVPRLNWRVSVRIGGHVMHTICETRKACMDYLQLHTYPIDDGWLLALPARSTQTGSNEDVLISA